MARALFSDRAATRHGACWQALQISVLASFQAYLYKRDILPLIYFLLHWGRWGRFPLGSSFLPSRPAGESVRILSFLRSPVITDLA